MKRVKDILSFREETLLHSGSRVRQYGIETVVQKRFRDGWCFVSRIRDDLFWLEAFDIVVEVDEGLGIMVIPRMEVKPRIQP